MAYLVLRVKLVVRKYNETATREYSTIRAHLASPISSITENRAFQSPVCVINLLYSSEPGFTATGLRGPLRVIRLLRRGADRDHTRKYSYKASRWNRSFSHD